MQNTHSTVPRRCRAASVALLLLGVAPTFPAQDHAGGASDGKLEVPWTTQVTVRDRQSRLPLRSLNALNTFTAGNTMINATTGASAAVRTPGLGKWRKTGPQTYSAQGVALLLNPTSGWTGLQKLTHSITVRRGEILFDSWVEVSDTVGHVITKVCTTASDAGCRRS